MRFLQEKGTSIGGPLLKEKAIIILNGKIVSPNGSGSSSTTLQQVKDGYIVGKT